MINFLVFLSFGDVLLSILEVIKNILIFVIVLGLIVGIHEFGHFIFARRAGILAREFAIGMGPVLWKKRKGETVYALRAIPIGGFCSIAGEELEDDPFKDLEKLKLDIQDGVIKGFYLDVDDDNIKYPIYKIGKYDIFDAEQTGKLYMELFDEDSESIVKEYPVDPKAIIYQKKMEFQIAPYNRTLGSKKKRQRAMVMFGGPLMNFILALIVFFIVGLFSGFADYKSSVVGSVSESMPVYETLHENDEITNIYTSSLGSHSINSWTDLSNYMDKYDEAELAEVITLTVKRDGVEEEIKITCIPFIGINSAGIGSDFDYVNTGVVKVGVYESITTSGISDNSLIKEGDIITSIWLYGQTHIDIPTWSDIRTIFDSYTGDSKTDDENKVYMKVYRDGVELEIYVIPYSKELLENQTTINGGTITPTSATIGISPVYKFSLIKSIGYSFQRTGESFLAVFDTLKLLFSGVVSIKNLSGPIGIYSITSSAAQYGILYVLSLIGLLSVNIGLLNLFPIPALDGGRLVFLGYEAITKKKTNPKVETILITVTMILLFGLMIFVAFEDVLRLFG